MNRESVRDSGADRRRSSVKLQGEIRSLRDVRPHDIVNQEFPGFTLNNDTRLSGNSLRNMGSLGTSSRIRQGIQTPQTGGAQRNSRGLNDARHMRINAALNLTKIPSSATSSARGGRSRSNSAGRCGPLKPPGSAYSQGYGLSNSKRKSVSHESLLNTPCSFLASAHRSRSRSPGSLSTARRVGGGVNVTGDQVKNVKVPKEKKTISEMAKTVFAFLEEHDCAARPAQWKQLDNPPAAVVSVSKFVSMFKFLASSFVGDDFFSGAKGEEEFERILEVSRLLKYPGQLSKSHLKSANAQHAWPTCLTFLSWLTCRVAAFLNPPAERNNILELNGNEFQEIAFFSFLNLFPLHFQRNITEEHIENELENFQQRLCETHVAECSKTIDELRQEKEEKVLELEKLRNDPNPAKNVRERLEKEKAVEADLAEKIRDIENKCKEFANINHLILDQESLKLNIKAKQAEIARLKLRTQKQPFSKDQAIALLNETKNLKADLNSIASINAGLDEDHKSRQARMECLRNELSTLCREFRVVEQYNEIVRYLQLDERLVISPNPFSASELEVWLKTASNTLRYAEEHVIELQEQIKLRSNSKSQESMALSSEMENLVSEISAFKMTLSQLQNHEKCMREKHRKELQEELLKLKDLRDDLHGLENQYKNASDYKAFAIQRRAEFVQAIEERKQELQKRQQELKKAVFEFQIEVEESLQIVDEARQLFAAYFRKFYLDNYGIKLKKPTSSNNRNTNS